MVDAGRCDPANEKSLLKVFRVSELGKIIIDMLSPSIGDLNALAACCRGMAACMREGFVCFTPSAPPTSLISVTDMIARSFGT